MARGLLGLHHDRAGAGRPHGAALAIVVDRDRAAAARGFAGDLRRLLAVRRGRALLPVRERRARRPDDAVRPRPPNEADLHERSRSGLRGPRGLRAKAVSLALASATLRSPRARPDLRGGMRDRARLPERCSMHTLLLPGDLRLFLLCLQRGGRPASCQHRAALRHGRRLQERPAALEERARQRLRQGARRCSMRRLEIARRDAPGLRDPWFCAVTMMGTER